MTISVDNWKERKTKNGEVYWNFNAAIDCESFILYTMGWQVFNGVLNPPSFRSGWRFYPMLLSSGDFSERLYEAVTADEQRKTLNIKLRPLAEAVPGIVATAMDFARLFPTT